METILLLIVIVFIVLLIVFIKSINNTKEYVNDPVIEAIINDLSYMIIAIIIAIILLLIAFIILIKYNYV